MKTLVLANQKGGVGKSAVVCALAYYFALQRGLRVLVVDFDHQQNTSKTLRTGGIAHIAGLGSSQVLAEKAAAGKVDDGNLVLISGDDALKRMERKAAEHNQYATNLLQFLKGMADRFDVCIIDTNPNPDIRQLASLVVADYVLSPIQLNQEAIDGIGSLLNDDMIGVRKIQATLNKKLQLIGLLPNLVEPTPFQKENFAELCKAFGNKLLIPMPGGGFAAIKKTTAIAEAQANGLPLWKSGKSTGTAAWSQMRPVFDVIAQKMEIKNA